MTTTHTATTTATRTATTGNAAPRATTTAARTAAPRATAAARTAAARTAAPRTAAPIRLLVGNGIAAASLAAGATAAVAAAGRAAGISLDVSGAPIPLSGFAMMTVICSAVGLILAVVLARVARSPRTTFVRATVALTALSLVPDVIADAAPGTKMLLMLTHLVAAAIVIPAAARRLTPTRSDPFRPKE